MNFIEEYKYNLYTGFFASTCGVIMGFNFGEKGTISGNYIPVLKAYFPNIPNEYFAFIRILLHAIFIVLQILFTMFLLRNNVKSMNKRGASQATVINFCINFSLTVVFAAIFFGEAITIQKMIGVVFIMTGTYIISTIKKDIGMKVDEVKLYYKNLFAILQKKKKE